MSFRLIWAGVAVVFAVEATVLLWALADRHDVSFGTLDFQETAQAQDTTTPNGSTTQEPAQAQESEADRRERENCTQFENQAQAQAELDEDLTDPLGLDPDANGVACEDFFGPPDDPGARESDREGGGPEQRQGDLLEAGGPKHGPMPKAKTAKARKGEMALTVPRLGLKDVPVPDGSTQKELDREGIIRLESSGAPWREGSNTSIVGHRIGFPQKTKNPYVFYELDEMRPGDKIILKDPAGRKYVYRVYHSLVVSPKHSWVMNPVGAKTMISLQTCTPIPTFEKRLVVRAELV